jgi:hypothetical protein
VGHAVMMMAVRLSFVNRGAGSLNGWSAGWLAGLVGGLAGGVRLGFRKGYHWRALMMSSDGASGALQPVAYLPVTRE